MRCARLLLLILLAATTPSRAGDIGGIYRGLPIQDVEIEGLDRSLAGGLKSGLAVTGRRGFLGLRPIAYEPGMLTADLERIRLYLARRGYPYARAEGELVPDEKGEKVKVILTVDPGPAVRIRSLDFAGLREQRPVTGKESRALGIEVGDVYSDRSVERARQAVLEHVLEQGYARATVEVTTETVDSTGVAVKFTGDRGRKWYFGEVRVNGVPESFHAVVDRAANIRSGELYQPRTVRDATDDIRALRLFRQVQVNLVATDSTTLDFVCDLSERKHRSIELGVGYLTDDGPVVLGSWEHRNLFEGGRGFRVFGTATQYKQLIESSVIFPALFRSPTTGVAAVAWERRVEPAYDSTDLRTSLLLTYRYTRRARITAGPQLQIIDVTETGADPDIPEEIASANGPVTSLIVEWAYDNSNDPLFPTRGIRTSWDHQIAPPNLGSISKFYLMRVGIAGYQKVTPRTTLAAKVDTGIGWPLWGSNDLLINYRYFAGGSNSHRGYQRERLGPTDSEGNPQGGELSMLGSVELRFPVWKAFEGALFLDAGQVWFHKRELSLADLSYAVGPGLAIKSPVGPIRFDYGIRLNPPDDGEPKRVFHFAVGYAF